MANHRERLDIAVEVLKAAESGARKSKMLVLANIRGTGLEKYLKIVVEGGLLQRVGRDYELTEKGHKLLEWYVPFEERLLNVRKTLKEMELEKESMTQQLQRGKTETNQETQTKTEAEPSNSNLRVQEIAFKRIDAKGFQQELYTLGFKTQEAREIVSWINTI